MILNSVCGNSDIVTKANNLEITQEAVSMVKPIQDPEEAAKRLMQEAYQRGSADNITIVVVRFLANQDGSSHGGSG